MSKYDSKAFSSLPRISNENLSKADSLKKFRYYSNHGIRDIKSEALQTSIHRDVWNVRDLRSIHTERNAKLVHKISSSLRNNKLKNKGEREV